tara:strand:- start:694 stop:936 length:243 start_codon:yes stop_codon:yes gene_type:complete
MAHFESQINEPTTQCMRCGMRYKMDLYECPYCVGKTNGEIIEQIHIPHSEQLDDVNKLGKYFIVIFAVILGLMIGLYYIS